MRIASVQMNVGDRPKKENLDHAETLIMKAEGADLILLPELWNIGYFSFDRYAAESEPPDGETASRMSRLAGKLGAYLFAGTWVVREDDGLYNTGFLFDPRGRGVAAYRKIHLFGHDSREREYLEKGTDIVVLETEIGTLGFATCYDLRFPELFRRMMVRGADIFLVASAWPHARLEHWRLFSRVRAMENLCFLASANCAGENRGVRFCGHSMVVDPWGMGVAEGDEMEGILWADVDLEMVTRVREAFPALRDIELLETGE